MCTTHCLREGKEIQQWHVKTNFRVEQKSNSNPAECKVIKMPGNKIIQRRMKVYILATFRYAKLSIITKLTWLDNEKFNLIFLKRNIGQTRASQLIYSSIISQNMVYVYCCAMHLLAITASVFLCIHIEPFPLMYTCRYMINYRPRRENQIFENQWDCVQPYHIVNQSLKFHYVYPGPTQAIIFLLFLCANFNNEKGKYEKSSRAEFSE